MKTQTVRVKPRRDGPMCIVPVLFDPRAEFGKVRAPEKVTRNEYTYRSTIFSMGGVTFIPLRKSHREAAGLDGNEQITVRIALDTGKPETRARRIANALRVLENTR